MAGGAISSLSCPHERQQFSNALHFIASLFPLHLPSDLATFLQPRLALLLDIIANMTMAKSLYSLEALLELFKIDDVPDGLQVLHHQFWLSFWKRAWR